MITVSKITVTNSYSVRYLDVIWQIADTTENLGDYTYQVFRSFSPDTGFTPVSPSGLTAFSYRDESVNLLDSTLKYYYKIQATNSTTTEQALSTIVGFVTAGVPDFLAEAILYQEMYVLQHVINNNDPARHVRVMIKKRFGQRCYNCWDSVKRAITKSSCPVCFGVGYTGGYLPVVSQFVSLSPATTQLSIEPGDIREQDNLITGWMGNLPIIQPEDILIDAANKRYRIINVQPTTKAQYVLRQQFTAQALPPTDIVYKVPL